MSSSPFVRRFFTRRFGPVPAAGSVVVTSFSDSFTRANESPLSKAGAWITPVGGTLAQMNLVSDVAVASTSNCGAIVATAAYAATTNQQASIVLGAGSSYVTTGIILRSDSSATNFYLIYISGANQIQIYKGSGFTHITDIGYGTGFSPGDTLTAKVTGASDAEFVFFVNGIQIGTYTDSSSPNLTGNPGIFVGTSSNTIASFTASNYTGNGLLNNLAGYWGYDEAGGANNAIDSSGHSLTLTQVSGPGSTAGIIGTARNGFAGNGSYFTSANSTFHAGSNSFSFVIWVNLDSLSQSSFPNAAQVYSPANDEWQLYWDNTSQRWAVEMTADGSTQVNCESTPAVTASAWHMIVICFDATNSLIKISVDNSTFATTSFAGPIFGGTGDFEVGARHGGSFLAGAVDASALWTSRVVSTDDVNLLWNGGAGLPVGSLT